MAILLGCLICYKDIMTKKECDRNEDESSQQVIEILLKFRIFVPVNERPGCSYCMCSTLLYHNILELISNVIQSSCQQAYPIDNYTQHTSTRNQALFQIASRVCRHPQHFQAQSISCNFDPSSPSLPMLCPTGGLVYLSKWNEDMRHGQAAAEFPFPPLKIYLLATLDYIHPC